MNPLAKISVIGISLLSLSGCTTLELVVFAGDAISYVSSGKSLSDHALSTVTQKDCAMHRVLTIDHPCLPTNKPAIPERLPIDTDNDAVLVAAAPASESTISDHAALLLTTETAPPQAVEQTQQVHMTKQTYAVIGSFDNQHFAQQHAQRYSQQDAHILTSGNRFRVVIGPFSDSDYSIASQAFNQQTGVDVWRLTKTAQRTQPLE